MTWQFLLLAVLDWNEHSQDKHRHHVNNLTPEDTLQKLGHLHRCSPDSSYTRYTMNKFKRIINPLKWSSVLLLTAVMAACGNDGDGSSAPIAGASTGVDLRTAGDFVILAKTGITTVPDSAITGNIGASPVTAAAMDTITCPQMLTGSIYGADAAYTGDGVKPCFKGTAPDTTVVANAILDMGTAYTDAAGRTLPDFTELYAGDISGQTLVPGLYKWGTSVAIYTDVTLAGSAGDIWIFQIAGDLTQAAATSVTLTGGAVAGNVFWQVGGGAGAAIGSAAHFEGTILAEKAITVGNTTTVIGNLYSQTAVTLDQNTVTQP
jgi:hypothetical protein